MTWTGMNKDTGKSRTELDHIRQSVADILTTPVGTRVMRRDYGSQLFELLDQPQNGATRLRLMAATVMAIIRWEPRVAVRQIQIQTGASNGRLSIGLDCERVEGPRTGERINLEVTA